MRDLNWSENENGIHPKTFVPKKLSVGNALLHNGGLRLKMNRNYKHDGGVGKERYAEICA